MAEDRSPAEDDTTLTWGVIDDQGQVVFAPTRLVEDLCRLRNAISAASTWADFRARAPTRYVEEVQETLEEEPANDARFDASVIPGYGDGDWPEWLHQDALDWMPSDLIERYGSVEDSVLNGRMLEIDASVGDDVARELEGRGFSCARDDEAVSLATGWS